MVKSKFYSGLVLLFFAVSVFIHPSTLQCQQKYNVLFIAVDDMNDRLSFLGSPVSSTPNLQRLINRGINFSNCYAQYPLCNPSRTSLLTGWRPDKTKIYNNKVRPRNVIGNEVQFMPEYFGSNGYHTERYGKILHGTFENDCKWDYAEPPEKKDGGDLTNNDSKGDDSKLVDGAWWINNVADSPYNDDNTEARHLVTRMRQTQTQPFFYAYGAHYPHNPFTPGLSYWNMSGDSSVKQLLPIDAAGHYSNLKGNGSGNYVLPNTPINDRADVPAIAFVGHPVLIKTDDDWRNTVHAYDGEVQQVDAQIGLILDEMDRQNLWDNTIVVFWSDHGQHLGEHEGLWKKETLFNESLHVPLIICVPGKAAGNCSRLVENIDIYPTLAELCGLALPAGIEGSSFAPLLDDLAQPWKRAVFSQVRRSKNQASINCRALYTEQYHYNFWDSGEEELYDRATDPHEYTNLAGNPQYASALSNMRTILAEGWTKSVPPLCAIKTFYRDKDSDGYGSKTDSVFACMAPAGYVENKTDCNDNNAAVNPASAEACSNNIDDNCDGRVDENNPFAKITPSGNLDICTTDSVELRANYSAGLTYQWLKNNSNVNGATNRKYVATTPGNYKVAITNTTGCTTTSTQVIVTNSCKLVASANDVSSAKENNTTSTLSISPNPSAAKVTVRFISDNTGQVTFTAYSAAGNLVFSKTKNVTKGENIFNFNFAELASGVYYLQSNTNNAQKVIKFIISR